MSDDVRVKLDATCDRTGKTETIELSLEEAKTFQETRQARSASAEALQTDLSNVAAVKMPDLIVAYRGTVVVLANINPKSDDALARLLHDVTRREAAFPKPVVKKRKAKDPEVQKSAAPSEDEEVPFQQPTA